MPPKRGGDMTSVIGIIGGSGLYQIDGMSNVEWRRIDLHELLP